MSKSNWLDFTGYLKEKTKDREKRKAKIDIKSIFDINDENDDIENLNLPEEICKKLKNKGIRTISKITSIFSTEIGVKFLVKDILTQDEAKEVFINLCVNNLIDENHQDYYKYLGFVDSDLLYSGSDKMKEVRTALNELLENYMLLSMIWFDAKNARINKKISSYIKEDNIITLITNSITRLFDAIDPFEKPIITINTGIYKHYEDMHCAGMHQSIFEKDLSFTFIYYGVDPHETDDVAGDKIYKSFIEDSNIFIGDTLLNRASEYEEEDYWHNKDKIAINYIKRSEAINAVITYCKRHGYTEETIEEIIHEIQKLNLLKLETTGNGTYRRLNDK